MSLTGSLHSMDFAELLQWLARGQKTGTLVVGKTGVEKQVYFREGVIIASASSDKTEHLGHFLVSHGFLDEVTLAQAVQMQEGNRMLLGKILTTIGAIGEVELEQMLRLKAEESVYEIFTWDDADFQFIEDRLPDFEMVPMSLDVQTLVLRGAKRLDDWNRIRSAIPSKECVPVAIAKLVAPEADAGTERILELVDDDRTVEEIALETHSSEFFVCRVLFEQIRLKHIKIVKPRQTEKRVEVSSVDTFDAGSLIAAATRHLEGNELVHSLRHLRAARDLDPDSGEVRSTVDELEEKIRAKLVESGIVPKAVPHLSGNLSDLSSLDISPEAGFILSRIDGRYDVSMILKIIPLSPLEAQVALWRLAEDGHIYFER